MDLEANSSLSTSCSAQQGEFIDRFIKAFSLPHARMTVDRGTIQTVHALNL